jgi:cyclopropane-fatty-acyl-phospholipid synthase
MIDRTLTQRFVQQLSAIVYGDLSVTTPDGRLYEFQGQHPGPSADLRLHDWRAVGAFARKGDVGLAETYRDGWWETSNLTQLMHHGLQNEMILNKYIQGGALAKWLARIFYSFNRNSLKGSKKNIEAHYDLGNSFYRLWLDGTMTYSSGLYHKASDTLTDAQLNKYDRILQHLPESGKLLEIGCGWGGFAQRALAHRDYQILGLTLSHEQRHFAQQRLARRADIQLQDYRDVQGTYDSIVSIEMFEAVGEAYWPVYFNQLKALLARKGRAMIQTITIADQHYEQYRKGSDAIRTFIFPGGALPSSTVFFQMAQRHGLRVNDHFLFGAHYAKTLETWRDTFTHKVDQVKSLGFDDKFIRLWQFYFASCIAGFASQRINVMQVELQHQP